MRGCKSCTGGEAHLTYLLAYVRAQAFSWTCLVSAYQRRQANQAVLLNKETSLPLGLDQVELLLLHAFSLTYQSE